MMIHLIHPWVSDYMIHSNFMVSHLTRYICLLRYFNQFDDSLYTFVCIRIYDSFYHLCLCQGFRFIQIKWCYLLLWFIQIRWYIFWVDSFILLSIFIKLDTLLSFVSVENLDTFNNRRCISSGMILFWCLKFFIRYVTELALHFIFIWKIVDDIFHNHSNINSSLFYSALFSIRKPSIFVILI